MCAQKHVNTAAVSPGDAYFDQQSGTVTLLRALVMFVNVIH